MKIVYRTVENNYDNLTEMLNNQIDILGELQTAMTEFIQLDDFKGSGADSIKAYYEELHGELVRAFKALIHDIDITMYYSNQSFQTDIAAFCGLFFFLAINKTSKLSNYILHQFRGLHKLWDTL